MIQPSSDSKVQNRKTQRNTYGLLPGPDGSCPYATTGCGGCWSKAKEGGKVAVCYVDKLMRARPNVAKVLERNTTFLKGCTEDQMEAALTAEFTRFEAAERKAGTTEPMRYRLHWSGDIFSSEYGRALTKAMAKFPETQFWVYSRSWDLVDPKMTLLKNVSFLLSLDPQNVEQGLNYLTTKKPIGAKVGISYMGQNIPDSLQAYMQANKLRVFECPVDSKKGLALEGACQRCLQCVYTPSKFIILFRT